MIDTLPTYIGLTFGLTSLIVLLLFIWTIRMADSELMPKKALLYTFLSILWLTLQAVLSISNIYNSDLDSFPPKIILFGILPPVLLISFAFANSKGREFIDSLPLQILVLIHIVRIPVEVVLYWLFLYKSIPELMTFEGRNFDIFAGITAPIIFYFAFIKPILGKTMVLIWNYACLLLLINIIVNALLSAPSPIQKFAFEQPNIAILYFPYSWLPTFIVPVVIFSHLATIRRLTKMKNETL